MAFSFNFDIPLNTEETTDKESIDDKAKDVEAKCSVGGIFTVLLIPAKYMLKLRWKTTYSDTDMNTEFM